MSTQNTLNRYPLSEAMACIANYKTHVRGLGVTENNIIKAYLVSYKDVAETYGIPENGTGAQPQYNYMRVYIGLEDVEGAHNYKLFLVPVEDVTDSNPGGKDYIPNGLVGNGSEPIDYVYDFNTPCPNTCDVTSPLYLAGQPR